MKVIRGRTWPWIVLLIAFMIFYLTPGFTLVLASLVPKVHFTLPIESLSLKWYRVMLESRPICESFWTTIKVALIVATIGTPIGLCSALAYTRYSFRGKSVFKILVFLPLFFNELTLALAMLLTYSYLGIVVSWVTMIFAELVYILPFIVLLISVRLLSYDINLEYAARDLGATPFQVFRKITLPLTSSAIAGAWAFAFLLSWNDYYIATYTGGSDQTVPVLIAGLMQRGFNPSIIALSSTIFLISFSGLLALAIFIYKKFRE